MIDPNDFTTANLAVVVARGALGAALTSNTGSPKSKKFKKSSTSSVESYTLPKILAMLKSNKAVESPHAESIEQILADVTASNIVEFQVSKRSERILKSIIRFDRVFFGPFL